MTSTTLPYSTPVWSVSGYTHMRQSTWLLVHFLGVSFWSMFRIQRNAWFDSGYNICFSLQSFFEEAHTLSALVLVLHAPCLLVWTSFLRPVVSGSHLFYLVFCMRSTVLRFYGRCSLDTSYSALLGSTVDTCYCQSTSSWVLHGVFLLIAMHCAVFLRGFQALMPCIMPGMDQEGQLRGVAVTVHHGRRHPCRNAEADPHGPCDQEIPLLLDKVIDVPVVQVVLLPGFSPDVQKTVAIPTGAVLGRFRPDSAETRDDSTVAVLGQGCGHTCYSGVQTCRKL